MAENAEKWLEKRLITPQKKKVAKMPNRIKIDMTVQECDKWAKVAKS